MDNTESKTLNNNGKKRRKELQGKELNTIAVDPWESPVDAKELLDSIASTLNKYAVLPKHTDTAITLWVAFTWFIDSVQVAPILAISAPEKQCGKSTVLNLVGRLTANPLTASNISPASIFRVIEKINPTLLIDEGDAFLRNNEDLRGILKNLLNLHVALSFAVMQRTDGVIGLQVHLCRHT